MTKGLLMNDTIHIYSGSRLETEKNFSIDFYYTDRLAAGDIDGDGKDEIIHGENTGNTDYRERVGYVKGVRKI